MGFGCWSARWVRAREVWLGWRAHVTCVRYKSDYVNMRGDDLRVLRRKGGERGRGTRWLQPSIEGMAHC